MVTWGLNASHQDKHEGHLKVKYKSPGQAGGHLRAKCKSPSQARGHL